MQQHKKIEYKGKERRFAADKNSRLFFRSDSAMTVAFNGNNNKKHIYGGTKIISSSSKLLLHGDDGIEGRRNKMPQH